jgi:hypothetical protein
MAVGQGLPAIQEINREFGLGQSLLSGLGSAMETFGMALGRGENAAKAFGAAMVSSIGGVASSMGSFMLTTGIGMLGLQSLNPFALISAGLALKALGGLLKGIGTSASPTVSATTFGGPAPANPQQQTANGNTTFIVQGDFNGDPVWIDRLAEKLRIAQRDRSVEVVFAG